MAGINNTIARNFVTMTANFQRLSEAEILEVLGVMQGLESDLTQRLQNQPQMTAYRRARYEALIKQNQESIKEAYKTLNAKSQTYLQNVAGLSSAGTEKMFKGLGLPLHAKFDAQGNIVETLESVVLSEQQIKVLASDTLIKGARSADWWAKQSQDLQDKFSREMKMGYAAGETVDQLVQRVRGKYIGKKTIIVDGEKQVVNAFSGGILDVPRHQAEALVRTSTQQIANAAHLEMIKANADIFKGILHVSTLDPRTTMICAARDGKMWDMDFNPIDHEIAWDGGPPLHFNCRSTIVPVTKSWEELGAEAGTDKKYLDTIGVGTRASMNGQVPASETFDSWFNGLPEEDQKSYLGPGKFNIWKEAGLNFSEMVDKRGNPLTLKQLAEAYDYKIKESAASGLPNVPAKIANALFVEQQAQALASEMALELSNLASTDVLEFEASNDPIKKIIVQEADFKEGMTPQEKLAYYEQAYAKEEAAAQFLKEKESLWLDNFDPKAAWQAGNYDELAKYNQFMQAFKHTQQSELPTMKKYLLEAKMAELAQIDKEGLALMNELTKEPGIKLFLEEWETVSDLQNYVGNTPLKYKEFTDSLTYLDNKFSKELASTDPIFQKALTKVLSQFNYEGKGATYLVYKETQALALELEKIEQAAMNEMLDLAAKDPGYKKNFDHFANGSKLTATELKEQVAGIMQISDQVALETIQGAMFAEETSPEYMAYRKTKRLLGPLNEYKLSNTAYQLEFAKQLDIVNADLAKVAQMAIKDAAGKAPLANSTIVKLGTKEYNLANPADMATYKKHKSITLSQFKKAVVEGKKVTKVQQAVYDSLVGAEKDNFDAAIQKAINKAKPIVGDISNAVPEPFTLQMSQMQHIKPAGGTNGAAYYLDTATKRQYVIKFLEEDIARNELLANKLYKAMGIDVPEVTLLRDGDRIGFVSLYRDGIQQATASQLAKAAGMWDGFGVDAWLANWDVVGQTYDNTFLNATGTAFRLDNGGAMRYRAMGGMKGPNFGNTVIELESLRNPKLNKQAYDVFKDISEHSIETGVKKVLALPDAKIRELVELYGPLEKAEADKLAETLIARKADLAKKFPHLVEAPPAALPTGRISAAEVQKIENGRIRGYALPVDKDLVEDQSLLFWFEKTVDGQYITGARFKITQEAESLLSSKISLPSKSSEMLKLEKDYEVFKEKLRLQWNVSHNRPGKAIDAALVKANIDDLNKTFTTLYTDLKKVDPSFADTFKSSFDQAIQDVTQSLSQKTFSPLGVTSSGKFQDSPLFNFAFTPKEKAVKNVGLVWKDYEPICKYKDLKKGVATQTDVIINTDIQPNGKILVYGKNGKEFNAKVYEAVTPDGVTIRLWHGEERVGQALKNQVEIFAPGKGADSVLRAIKTVEEELGIKLNAPALLDAEEMYLTKIARNRGNYNLLDELETMKGASQAERVEFLKGKLSTNGGRIDKLPGYNPYGGHDPFDVGYRHFYDPEFESAEWKEFTQKNVLHHRIQSKDKTMAEILDITFDSGGSLVSTADKPRVGLEMYGMSPNADLGTGGADYVFTRLFGRNSTYVQKAPGIVWKGDNLARLDRVSYEGDKFGNTQGNFVQVNGNWTKAQLQTVSGTQGNETIFKNGLSVFENLDHFNCASLKEAQDVFDVLKKHGWGETWVDGRKVTDIIKILGKNIGKGVLK